MLAAIKIDNSDCVRILIDAGAELGVVNKDGWSALHMAVRTGDIDMVNMLISAHPDSLTVKSNNDRTILHTACLDGHVDVVTTLLQHSQVRWSPWLTVRIAVVCGATPLIDAARAELVTLILLR